MTRGLSFDLGSVKIVSLESGLTKDWGPRSLLFRVEVGWLGVGLQGSET